MAEPGGEPLGEARDPPRAAEAEDLRTPGLQADALDDPLPGQGLPRTRRSSILSLGLSLNLPVFGSAKAKRRDPAQTERRVFVNTAPDGEWADHKGRVRVRYASNAVKSSKYTLVTFIPKNLYEQFRSFANAYFLFLIILQLFPQFQYTSPIVTAAPLTFIVTVVAIKNGIEDWERHKQDKELNERRTLRLLGPDGRPWTNPNVRGGISIGLRELNPVLWIEALLNLVWKLLRTLFSAVFRRQPAPKSPSATVGRNVGRVRTRSQTGPLLSVPDLELDGAVPVQRSPSQAIGVPAASERVVASADPTHVGPEITVLDARPAESGADAGVDAEVASLGELDLLEDELELAADAEEFSGLLDGWGDVSWQDVVVGDILLLQDGDPVPADCVVLSSSEQDGMIFVETRNLDGETNLKVRRSPIMTVNHHMRDAASCRRVMLKMDAEQPSENLHSFQGVMEEINTSTSDLRVATLTSTVAPLTLTNLVLRGSVIRNTHWCIALVVYTGSDAKIIRNAGATPSKRSLVERKMNPQVVLNILILICMSLTCAITHYIYANSFNFTFAPWTPSNPQDNTASSTTFIFFNCMIMFQNIIPLALYISADLGKTLQALFIYFDDFLAQPIVEAGAASADDFKSMQLSRATPRTWNLSDDLGQIEFVFSDKTGTLTQNLMEFRKCSVNGIVYGGGFLTEQRAFVGADAYDGPESAGGQADWEDAKRSARKAMRRVLPPQARRHISKDPTFADERMWRDLSGDSGREQMRRLQMFWTHLAVCHTVLVELKKEGPGQPRTIINYKAQSPDEEALVAAARDSGFVFLGRKDTEITILALGKERVFTVLNVLEFTSERKRMSVIAKADDGKIFLFCKGADSVIFERLAPVYGNGVAALRQRAMEDLTVSHIDGFASEGLRTLCVAYRQVPAAEYSTWNCNYVAASTLLKNRDEKMARVAEQIEVDLQLLGCTGIDDQLQDGVPQAIEKLRSAGLKIWVLTGDKLETAINIGFASNLLHQNSTLLIIKSCQSAAAARRNMVTALKSFWYPSGAPSDHSFERALIIDGDSLEYALDPDNRELFLELACRCRAVMCCRASPLQKADVTKLVRQGLGAACLAIGDGANDVNMIQQANIGIGITGKEGLQAAMSSDYTIAQFRFLARLLLVHGRWCYMRISDMIFIYFYKNILWLFVLFWYQFYCGFSASDITDFVFGMFYSTLFTFLPNFVIGIFEQDVNDRAAMAVPQLYDVGIRQALFTHEHFWLYMGDAIYQSCVYFFGCIFLFEDATPDPNGYSSDKTQLGNLLAWMLIINGNLYILFIAKRWTWIIMGSLGITLAIFLCFTFVYWGLPESLAYGTIPQLLTMPAFWLQWALCTVAAFLPRFLSEYVRQEFVPTDSGIVREIEKFRIQSPVLHGADIWSSNDLDQLYASWEKLTAPEASSNTQGLTSAKSSAPADFSNASASLSNRPTGSESFDSLLRLRRVASSFSRSITTSFSALKARVARGQGPSSQANLVYLDRPAEAVPYSGFAFAAEPGMKDAVEHVHSRASSSADDGEHRNWLGSASSRHRGSVGDYGSDVSAPHGAHDEGEGLGQGLPDPAASPSRT
ncbi:hypothetical protein DFJ74DRAFT_689733 [Hyaloraphidium curvatum]|nr:hypothetical protein DFJ74DRAFT_689733 [Hyaloraphidium curvatum]